ncbi:unnamed protein product [Microthlaspi erraticum]|uniref:Uncharacterized protein n=1 Tax=Microthlaspi erraticum TaxID=1685480 RepID=A0A6D2HJ25_9BRAS|nr:unnamed protein product [Microthlaspi erraticum]
MCPCFSSSPSITQLALALSMASSSFYGLLFLRPPLRAMIQNLSLAKVLPDATCEMLHKHESKDRRNLRALVRRTSEPMFIRCIKGMAEKRPREEKKKIDKEKQKRSRPEC